MFLTAVLQAHTDSLPRTDDDAKPGDETAESTVAIPARLEEALSVPLKDRAQPLPAVHRSRWV